MRTATKEWWRHFEFPRTGHEWQAEWKKMWHDMPFWQVVAVIFGAMVFVLLVASAWLQPYVMPDSPFLPTFSAPWQRGWPYPMW